MDAKKFLEKEYDIWCKIDDKNLSKQVLIEFAGHYSKHKNEILKKKIKHFKKLVLLSLIAGLFSGISIGISICTLIII